MEFTKKELRDLFLAWLILSLAFALIFAGTQNILSYYFLTILLISGLTAGIGFVLHELMHKFVAQRYKLKAEFRALYKMLFLGLAMSVFGFIFIAPGAVFIRGFLTKERNGKISIAGPLTNMVLALVFLIPFLLIETSGTLNLFLSLGFRINALLGAFNMIPVMPIDGAKILQWNKTIYWITLTIAAAMFVLSLYL